MRRLVVCVGYIGREAFEFDCEGDRLQVESMLATRDDDIRMVHWKDLDASLRSTHAYDLRNSSWGNVDLAAAAALLILEAPAPGSIFADFDCADAVMHEILRRGIPAVNSPRTFLDYPDKRYLVDRPDMPFPATRLVTAASDIDAAIRDLGEVVVVKPLIGAGGDGVVRMAADAGLVRAALEPGREYLVQEYLPAITAGERSLYFFAKQFRYAAIKRPVGDEFRCNWEHSLAERHHPTEEELALARDAVARFGSPSLIERVDLCGGKIIEMTIECPALQISTCGVEREVGGWTYEAIDMAIAAAGAELRGVTGNPGEVEGNMKKRTIGCIGYFNQTEFDYDFSVDRRQIESMLAARDDDFLMVHWEDLDLALESQHAWDIRRGVWTAADFGACDALMILLAPWPGTTWNNFPRSQEMLRSMVARDLVVLPTAQTFLDFVDKRYLLERDDMPFPRTVLLTDSSDIPSLLEGFGETVIVKPIVGFSGLGVLKLPNSVERVREALEPGQEYLLQEYLPEIADGERCLFFFAKKFRYAIVKRLHAGEYIANADHAEFEAYQPTAAELALACDAVERFGSSSLIERIDIVGSKVLEMTVDSPGLAIHIAGVEREVGHWTYEAIDQSIDARSRS